MKSNSRLITKVAVIAAVGGLASWSETLAAGAHRALSGFLAHSVSAASDLLGMPTYVDGTAVYSLGYSVRVVPECNGLIGTSVALTAIALLRAGVRAKLQLALATFALSFALNAGRIWTVLLVGTRSQRGAEFVHETAFPVFWFGLAFGLWFYWLKHEFEQEQAEPHSVAVAVAQ